MLATVLVPTHDHGPLLSAAVRSALDQTVRDLEVLVVGDGMDDATRRVARELKAHDPRVTVFDFPKAPRHGEESRTRALASARGDIVLYLSDDDIWLPGHVEGMAEALGSADFAHCVPVYVRADQELGLHVGHFRHPEVRARLEGRWNFIPLSAGGHTRELYERLAGGWVTTPEGVWTDLHMWRRLLAVEGCRPTTSPRATLLHFAASDRTAWSLDRRAAELSQWAERARRPGYELELTREVLGLTLLDLTGRHFALTSAEADRSRLREAAAAAEGEAERARGERREAEARVAALVEELGSARGEREAARTEAAGLGQELQALRERLVALEGTLTWRLRGRILLSPRLAALRAVLRPFGSRLPRVRAAGHPPQLGDRPDDR